MDWSLKVSLLPGEEIIEEGETKTRLGVMPEHTPILTNKRVLFKYNTFSTGLVRAFNYCDIIEAEPVSRFKIDYLKCSVFGRDFFFKVDDPVGWSAKIKGNRERLNNVEKTVAADDSANKTEILRMLDRLHAEGILDDKELEVKRRMVKG